MTLTWTAGNATKYDVYLRGALVASNLTTASLKTGSLSYATQYFWQVVAKNAAGSTSGPTWLFTTKAAKGRRK